MSKRLTRAVTRDKETIIHAAQQIGLTRETTPEGFLLCRDVPIARVGTMIYGPGEVPIRPGPTGVAYVTRDAASLFDEATISSFNGKPVVNDHPDEDVTPRNWKKYSVGVCMNPRRGTTEDTADVILADLLITDQNAIADILSGKREVSAGYDADYEQTGEGEGRQTSIIGNHVALVARGRCGPRCAIGDHLPPTIKESLTMGTPKQTTESRARRPLPESVRKIFRDAAQALEGLGEEATDPDLGGSSDEMSPGEMTGGGGDTHIHIHAGGDTDGTDDGAFTQDTPDGGNTLEQRLAALEEQHAAILDAIQQLQDMLGGGAPATDDAGDTPAGDDMGGGEPPMGDEPMPTKDRAFTGDSAALKNSFDQLLADAEVLVPGIRVPTFDAALPRARSVDAMCSFRRKVLTALGTTHDGAALLSSVAGDEFDVEAADCASAAMVFKAAAGARRLMNNRSATSDANRLPASAIQAAATNHVASLADLNKRNQAYWADQRAKLAGSGTTTH